MLFSRRRSFTLAAALGHAIPIAVGLSGCSREIQIASGGAGGARGSYASMQAGFSASPTNGQSISASETWASVDSGSGVVSATATSSSSSDPGVGDVFDPNEMYFTGVINDISDYPGIVHWSSVDTIMTGFPPAEGNYGAIRPTDGRYIYPLVGPALREFHCDACPYQATYPSDTLANDPPLSVAPCIDGIDGIVMLMSPEGTVLHNCGTWGEPWYDASGVEVYDGGEGGMLFHLGYDGIAATNTGSLFDLTTSTEIPTSGLPPFASIAYRALPPPDAFLLVVPRTSNRAQDGSQDLWKVDRMGVGTKVGELPPLPPGATNAFYAAIDGHGAVFQACSDLNSPYFTIIRRTIMGDSSVVVTDHDQHLLTIGNLVFATGP